MAKKCGNCAAPRNRWERGCSVCGFIELHQAMLYLLLPQLILTGGMLAALLIENERWRLIGGWGAVFFGAGGTLMAADSVVRYGFPGKRPEGHSTVCPRCEAILPPECPCCQQCGHRTSPPADSRPPNPDELGKLLTTYRVPGLALFVNICAALIAIVLGGVVSAFGFIGYQQEIAKEDGMPALGLLFAIPGSILFSGGVQVLLRSLLSAGTVVECRQAGCLWKRRSKLRAFRWDDVTDLRVIRHSKWRVGPKESSNSYLVAIAHSGTIELSPAIRQVDSLMTTISANTKLTVLDDTSTLYVGVPISGWAIFRSFAAVLLLFGVAGIAAQWNIRPEREVDRIVLSCFAAVGLILLIFSFLPRSILRFTGKTLRFVGKGAFLAVSVVQICILILLLAGLVAVLTFDYWPPDLQQRAKTWEQRLEQRWSAPARLPTN